MIFHMDSVKNLSNEFQYAYCYFFFNVNHCRVLSVLWRTLPKLGNIQTNDRATFSDKQ